MSNLDDAVGPGTGEEAGERQWTDDNVIAEKEAEDAAAETAEVEKLVDEDQFTDEEEDEGEPLDEEAVKAQLAGAMEICDLKSMKKLLKRADELGSEAEVVGEATVLLERCQAAKKELIACVNGGKGPAAVEKAIAKAREIPNFNGGVVEGAKVALVKLRGGGDLAAHLSAARDVCDFAELAKLLPKATRLGFDGVVVAEAWELLEKCEAALKGLQEAVSSGHARELETAIERAKAIPNFHDQALGRAEVALSTLLSSEGGEHKEFFAALEVASQPGANASNLSKLVKRGREMGISELNANFKRAVTQLGSTELVVAQLTEAMRLRTVSSMESALEFVKTHHPSLLSSLALVAEVELELETRVRIEEPVLLLLWAAVKSKKMGELTRAVDAGERIDGEFEEAAELEAVKQRKKAKQKELERMVSAQNGEAAGGAADDDGDAGGPLSPKKAQGQTPRKSARPTSPNSPTSPQSSGAKNPSGGGAAAGAGAGTGTGGVSARAAKALEKHVMRAEASRKDEVGGAGGKVQYRPFNPPELEQCRELKKVVFRLENDLSSGLKRCAFERLLPELLSECKVVGLRTKLVQKAGSLVFRCQHAKALMNSALKKSIAVETAAAAAAANDQGESKGADAGDDDAAESSRLECVELLKASVVYAKTKVHDKFNDALVEECRFQVARLQHMRLHEKRLQSLTSALKASPLYFATEFSGGNSGSGAGSRAGGSAGGLAGGGGNFGVGLAPPGTLSDRGGSTAPLLRRKSSKGANSFKESFKEIDEGSGTGNLERRLSMGVEHRNSFSDLRRSMTSPNLTQKLDPAVQASALDNLLRLAVDEATDPADPTFGAILAPDTSLAVLQAEHCLTKRQLLREAFAWLLKVPEHDSAADPKAASKLLSSCRQAVGRLQKHEGLHNGDEEVHCARLAEAVLSDDVEVVRTLLDILLATSNVVASSSGRGGGGGGGSDYSTRPPAPPAAHLGSVVFNADKEKSFMELATENTAAVEEVVGGGGRGGGATAGFEAATGYSLVHYAALHGSVNVAQFLVARYGPELLFSGGKDGVTCLHVAAMRGRKAFLQAMVPVALKANTFSAFASTAPEQALASLLSRADAGGGATLLHLACFHGRPLTAEWLVESGASLESKDLEMRSPIDCAKDQGHAGLAADLKLLRTNPTTSAV